jgi:hypothetical protein
MRRLTAILMAVLLCFAATGCGGDDSDSTSTKDDGGAVGDLPTDQELAALLLTVDDLPGGWSVDTSSDDDSDEESAEDEDEPDCLKEAGDDTAEAEASIDFIQGDDFPALNESLESYDPEHIADELHKAVEQIDGCGEFDMPTDEILLHGRVTRIDFKQVGDESATWSMELGAQGLTIEFLITYFRSGPIGASFSYAEPGAADQVLYEQLLDKAVAKLAA